MPHYDPKVFYVMHYFWSTCAIVAYHHLSCEVEPHSWRGVLDKTLSDKVCQWLATDPLGISEQYLFFCHQTGMVGHWILRLHTFYKSTHVEFKTLSTVETLTPKHKYSSTFLHFYTYYTYVYPLFQMIVMLF
jgi:hypothetical protein